VDVRVFNVLFISTGNSARSVMAEALLNALGGGRFHAFSAGCRPTGVVNRFAVELLGQNRIPTAGLRSKSWTEFVSPDAPNLDFVFTVCDRAAKEPPPLWPGQPLIAHWSIPDVSHIEGDVDARRRAFFRGYSALQGRLLLLVNLPIRKLDRAALQERIESIRMEAAALSG